MWQRELERYVVITIYIGRCPDMPYYITSMWLTVRRESQLSADHRGIWIVPGVITHSAVLPSNADLYSTSSQSILVIVELSIIGQPEVVVLHIIWDNQPHWTLSTHSCKTKWHFITLIDAWSGRERNPSPTIYQLERLLQLIAPFIH